MPSRVLPLFIPEKRERMPLVPMRRSLAKLYPGIPRQIDEHRAPEFTSQPRVDLSSIELSFEDDGLNELPAVVKAYNGVFALADKQDPLFARFVIEPPDWTVPGSGARYERGAAVHAVTAGKMDSPA